MATITTAEQKRQLSNHNVELKGDETLTQINTLWKQLLIKNNQRNGNIRAKELFRRQLGNGDFKNLSIKNGDRFELVKA